MTELNTPASFICALVPVILLVVRQQLDQFPFSTERGRRDGINPSHGDNVATAEVATAKWQSENVVESEVSRSETLFLGYRKGVGKQLVQPPFLF